MASRSPVLTKGNIFTDAPGTGDMNKAHVDRAQIALKNADKIMVVLKMERCLAIKKHLGTINLALDRRGPGGVLLVLTYSAVSFRSAYITAVISKLI